MAADRPVLLLSALPGSMLARFDAAAIVQDLAGVKAHATREATLVSFGTGVIVPPRIYERFSAAYNLHPASPDFPGRDPHHWAVYEGARRYGATLHVMTERVDSGPIVDVELEDVPEGAGPKALLDIANGAGVRILERVWSRLRAGETLPPIDAAWAPVKRARADFVAMCRIDPGLSAEEFERRLRAFDGEEHDNLYVELHGRTFRIHKPPTPR